MDRGNYKYSAGFYQIQIISFLMIGITGDRKILWGLPIRRCAKIPHTCPLKGLINRFTKRRSKNDPHNLLYNFYVIFACKWTVANVLIKYRKLLCVWISLTGRLSYFMTKTETTSDQN
jgi:hypothetical protein